MIQTRERLGPGVVLVAILLTVGCAMTETRRQVSSGAIGCPPAEIAISEESNYAWRATCRGYVFYCGVAVGGGACTKEAPPVTGAYPPSPDADKGMAKTRRESSSGFLGCPAAEVVITDADNMSWRASCRGRTVQCSAAVNSVSCQEPLAPAGP